jgi:PleD family two-component response regulator
MTPEPGPSALRAAEISQSSRPPLILILDDQEWAARAFESVLSPQGYSVIRCRTGRQLLEFMQALAPDAFLIKHGIPDVSAFELCRTLRAFPQVGAITPIILSSATPLRGNERLEAFAAGAWHLISVPVDAEELIARLSVYLQSKLEADRVREVSLVDLKSGFYSVQGLLRIVKELSLDASRHNSPIGCVVIGPEKEPQPPLVGLPEDSNRIADRLVDLMTAVGRGSDAIGRLSQTEFGVVAPRTDSSTVLQMANRLHEAAQSFASDLGSEASLRLRVGCYAVDDFRQTPIEPVEILTRATMALRHAQSDTASSPIVYFGQSFSAR